MAFSTGIDASTGAALSDWDHVQQSIAKILTTPIGSRVMRRDFGSRLPDLIDNKLTARNVLQLFSEAAVAIARWEPRFRVEECAVDEAGPSGRITLALYGTYFPRGHLGDFTNSQAMTTRPILQRLG
ncbi:GPW/gp25 family protein [Rhizobium sp. CFBP 8762]|uniref:GPW/gp25 family protein n=1 Tax=Rhizobium sp. CFBP 8762 TaxID=2775279 RepID=UPI00177E96AC|nr:GPW/gp25 family protein [Rhizobium sp. CFBP 8762]MBD8556906.1 GPW/gp25 family protein [Rhizobium sp. CFBP 8762]